MNANYTHIIFSHRLKRAMARRNVRSTELAKMIYVSKATIAGYRVGRRIPDLERMRLICINLDVSADYLLGLKDSLYINRCESCTFAIKAQEPKPLDSG